MAILQVELGKIKPNGYQPRAGEDRAHVDRLAANMRARGFIQSKALDVVKTDSGGYDIVSGHHRYLAALAAGLSVVPVNVLSGSERDLRIEASSSNDSNLSQKPMEQARAYGWFVSDGMEIEEIGAAMCKPVPFIERRLSLLKLDDSIAALVDSGNIPITLAELVAELPDHYRQVKAIAKIKGLELGAAKAAITAMIQAAAGVSLPGFEELSEEEKDRRRAAADGFEVWIKTLDRAAGSVTKDDLTLAVSALKSPAKTLDHLDAIVRQVERARAEVLTAQGVKIAGGAAVSDRFNPAAVCKLRAKSGFSVREFAARAGVDYSNYSAIERGHVKRPHPATLRKIAAAGGVDVGKLYR